MIERISIYDLDGVLVDTSHRYRNLPCGSIDLDYWFANNTPEKVAQDKLLPKAADYRKDLADPACYVIICTARAAQWFDLAFIADRLGQPDKVLCRKQGDMRDDCVIKRNQLAQLFALRQFAKLKKAASFWDDNKRNIWAVATLGIACYHVKSTICEAN